MFSNKAFRAFILAIGISLLTTLALRACFDDVLSASVNGKQVGDRVDSLNGVYVYYNGSVDHVNGRNLAPDGYNLGLKYQCVEFVKRYYYEHYNHKMPDSYGHAKSFFNKELGDGALNKERNLIQYQNGGKTCPKVGDLLVFDGNPWNEFGHVAIVSKVEKDEIEIIQQNPGPSASSRDKIGLVQSDSTFLLQRRDALGWLRR